MKVALSPIEFARRARRLYSKNEAVVDGDLRFTYEEFLNRCDQWSDALQKMGVKTVSYTHLTLPTILLV